MSATSTMAIELGPRRLRALLASSRRGGGLRIRRALVEDVPADLNVDDPQELGRWAGGRLQAAGFPRGKAIIALAREHAAFKRLTLPTIDEAELPDMTRLAMHREMSFDADDAVIDFVPIAQDQISTTVVAVAVPQRLIDFAMTAAKAAGCRVGRVSLRVMGAAAIAAIDQWHARGSHQALDGDANEPGSKRSSSSLVIDILGDSIELCVVEDGAVRLTRAAEVPPPRDQLEIAETVVTEARRTWMSYQVTCGSAAPADAVIQPSDSSGVSPMAGAGLAVVVMGDQRVCAYAAEPVGQLLGVPVRVMDGHPSIDNRAASNDMDAMWPLAGLLLESARGEPALNLASPRRAPDLAARSRTRRLLAAGIVVVAALGAWTMARQQLNALELEAEQLVQAQRDEAPHFARYWRDQYKLDHLKHWESSGVDWLQHATYLATIVPPRDQLVLDSWSGTAKFNGVRFESTKFQWSIDQQLTIVIDGEARDRETADRFRAALVQSAVYETATPGSDARGGRRMPFGFRYQLRARDISPPDAQAETVAGQPTAAGEESS